MAMMYIFHLLAQQCRKEHAEQWCNDDRSHFIVKTDDASCVSGSAVEEAALRAMAGVQEWEGEGVVMAPRELCPVFRMPMRMLGEWAPCFWLLWLIDW